MQSPINHIVFYGTLMQKAGARGLRHEPECTYLQDITIKGDLYSVHDAYPALVEGDGSVAAEVFKINDPNILRRFDAIEGCHGNSKGNLYNRDVIFVEEIKEEAYVYRFNQDVSRLKEIEGGDWYKFSTAK